MPRFDPAQPDHVKYLAPVEDKPEPNKKSKKRKQQTDEMVEQTEPKVEAPKVEVSKEQFYKISDSLKETISKPTTFSLRSLFGHNEDAKKEGRYYNKAVIISLHLWYKYHIMNNSSDFYFQIKQKNISPWIYQKIKRKK